ncbi:hypothetical protein [Streptomyces sp. ME19-01-6]|uniref:hypothetical protein n=1 Tax=Streptomyces sp. ME19-01-6 TaxID=3028686 RepID=UPI0029A4106D|nr:hypothetical protein [Streptomyces sp. ME19-01-6]MDX3232977.1 hypothetical protein [Streptomyces sp. ME19-01-6]
MTAEPELPGVVEYAHDLETAHRASTWPGIPAPDHCQQQHRGEIMTVSPNIDPVYDPRAWETYRRNTGCGCTAPTPVDCKVPHGTGEWLCACHRLSGPPTTEPGKPLGDLGTSKHFLEPNRCLSVHAGIFRCRRPIGHPGDHRAGRTFWGRRAEDEQPYPHEPGVVAYRSADGRILRCLQHAPDPSLSVELTPVAADDLPDGGVCTDLWCGADVLIPQERQR